MGKKKLVIFGGSGVGRIAQDVASSVGGIEVLGFINDHLPKGSLVGNSESTPVIGGTKDIVSFLKADDVYFLHGFIGMQMEKSVYFQLQDWDIPNSRFLNLIHPSAQIPKGLCKIGNGNLLSPLSQLSPDASIGNHCLLMGGSFLGHDSKIEDCVSLATNCVVGANVQILKGSHIGSNAVIREKVVVGEFSLIGAGSVVLEDVPPESVVVGNPGRIIKSKQSNAREGKHCNDNS